MGTVSTWTREGSEGSYQHVQILDCEGSNEGSARLFSVVPSDRARGNGHKLKNEKDDLNIRFPS